MVYIISFDCYKYAIFAFKCTLLGCCARFVISLSLSNAISFVNLTNAIKCFLISVSLLVGQVSVRITLDINLALSLFNRSHSYNKWSIVWSSVPHEV